MTGLEHDVPPGHYSLTHPEYEVLPDRRQPPKAEPEPEAAPKKPKRKK